MNRCMLGLALITSAWAQTKVDLRSQSKSVDFSEASSTRPFKSGLTLPTVCAVGDMFFKTNAPAGQNLFGCVSPNNWALQADGEGGGGAGAITIALDDTTIGTTTRQNFVTGTGLVNAIGDTGTQINVQQSADTAVLQSLANAQSGAALACVSGSDSATTFTCNLSPTLQQYSVNMLLHWRAGVNGAGGATTLNVDTLGAIPVRGIDGVSNPTAADIAANEPHLLWFDGSVFRILRPRVNVASVSAQPTCDATQRGRIWQTQGANGVKDEVAVCAKDAGDAFDWRILY